MGPLEETLSKSKIEPTGREIYRVKNSCSWAEKSYRREMTYFILILWAKFCLAEKCKDLYWNQQKGSNSRNFIVLLEGESLQINCSGGFSFLFLQNFQVKYKLWFIIYEIWNYPVVFIQVKIFKSNSFKPTGFEKRRIRLIHRKHSRYQNFALPRDPRIRTNGHGQNVRMDIEWPK